MLSVIICTHNPRKDLLAWTLASLGQQSLPRDQWELILVDNRSTTPLVLATDVPAELQPLSRMIREEEPGLSAARCAGIQQACGEVVVFVDDDNHLAPDYLEVALRIFATEPTLGCFGGRSEGFFEWPPSDWLRPLIGYLGVRDYGDERIVSRSEQWGPWEPIGAGMVARREVAMAFRDYYLQQKEVARLGRNGDSLASCEDSLIAFLSIKLGYANAYEPSLRLKHFIKDFRVLPSYFARLMLAMGGSYRQLQLLKGHSNPTQEFTSGIRTLIETFGYRLEKLGDVGYLQWLWDVGNTLPNLNVELPRITVVVPTFNSATTLRRTMESLKAQAYPKLEVIVQDGGSTDETLKILAEYSSLVTELESTPDHGQSDAINRGFRRSRGEIEAWLCGDDEYRPGILYLVALEFLLQPEVDFMVGSCLRVFPDGSQALVCPRQEQLPALGYHNFIDQPSTFWRRSLRERAGPLDESLHYAFDWEYWNRFIRIGARIHFLPHPLSVYYFSDQNKTSTAGSRQVPELIQIVQRYGPLDGKLARIYHFLYRNFDIAGCYDCPPTAAPSRIVRFHRVLAQLCERYGHELIYNYNWSYASRQERKLVWYR